MSYESDLTRLQAIVDQLEREDLELDRALQLFEEGIARLRSAHAALADADGRVRLLVEQVDGSLVVSDDVG